MAACISLELLTRSCMHGSGMLGKHHAGVTFLNELGVGMRGTAVRAVGVHGCFFFWDAHLSGINTRVLCGIVAEALNYAWI